MAQPESNHGKAEADGMFIQPENHSANTFMQALLDMSYELNPELPSTRSDRHSAVTITLTARHARSDFVVPQRVILLTKVATATQVGRASKQESKGFVAARENAWFDSPVMSRQHAELSADFDAKTVLIQDIGSLHGTFHRTKDDTNEDRLPTREKVPLKDGDILRFGTDIYRGQLTFPPCTVHVGLAWTEEQVPPPERITSIPVKQN
ncbi:hypothetical protein TruAng_002888 [Truncatella angustata]|nr:hypothetical protein TruAng_002888 [Truncatella angustata]